LIHVGLTVVCLTLLAVSEWRHQAMTWRMKDAQNELREMQQRWRQDDAEMNRNLRGE
jgi:hypothetical protein